MFRSGTVAHNNGEKVSVVQKEISSLNIAHGKSLSDGKKPDITVLNSRIVERPIVNSVKEAVEEYNKKLEPQEQCIFSRHPISVSPRKGAHLNKIWKSFNDQLKDKVIQWIMCKSGKDRTQAAVLLNELMMIEKAEEIKSYPETVKFAREQLVSSGHGSAVAANVGATMGIHGTKIGNVYSLLKLFGGGDNILLKFQDELETKICNLNKIELPKKN
ncbi:MAG UNVERIFIED_CONTAM: hypothetical protein LVQ98_09420 [Rickettsiaceae bacterium]|jgi:hypothetical protein